MKIFGKKGQPVSVWTGGTTRQLYIFPGDSNYAERNFSIRISTATVEVEQSAFTSLPGYFRTLMVLEGELRVEHEDQHIALLRKFDTDHFLGEWKTTGYGLATDFNVMAVDGYDVTVEAYTLENLEENIDYAQAEKLGIYVYRGQVSLMQNGVLTNVSEGDFVLLEGQECHNTIQLKIGQLTELIVTAIQKLF